MYYQVTDFYDPVGQKQLTSVCPDCGNKNCLELFFYQKRTESPFSKRVSKKVTGVLYCHHTQSEIAPVQWSDEIENYFNNEKTKLRLNPTSFKFTKWLYIILLIPIIGIGVGIGYSKWQHQSYNDQSANIESADIGDKIEVMYSELKNNEIVRHGTTWLLIKGIEGDTVVLQRHKELADEDFDFDLGASNFSGETIKASLKSLRNRSLYGFDPTKQEFAGYITEIRKQD